MLFSLKIAWAIALLSIDSAQWSIGIKNPTTQTPRRIEPLQQLTGVLNYRLPNYLSAGCK
ncbi:hypothetical protein QUB56_06880 [Microcoleus sp. AR_TQ3_B6]|uniref:hypothetical protein n=1 Tax=Microcoleus sp. AR_TQ3_B6 TaxID=3055284 RepID=UPI002FD24A2E